MSDLTPASVRAQEQPAAPKTVTVRDVMWAGEGGEWIVAEGHVDLDSFKAAADALTRQDIDGLEDDEMPSAGFDAEHIWQRPMTWEWFQRCYPDGFATTDNYDRMLDDGAMEPCSATDEGAQAWTCIGTGA